MAACDIQYWCVVGLLDTFTEGATVDVLKEETKTLFSSLDKDENGKIDKEELMQGFPQLDANAAGMLIAEADQDNDGSISFDELWAIIQQATGEKELMSGRDAPVVDTDPKEMQKTIIRLNAEVAKRDALISCLKRDLVKARILGRAQEYADSHAEDVYTGVG